MKENEVGGACGMRGKGEKIVQVFMGELEGKRPIGMSRRRSENGIRMDLKEMGWGGGM
jgi:hypothetical protein